MSPLLRKGGFIIADNTLWDGRPCGRSGKEKDPQTRGIREFNDMIRSRTDIESVILPLRDGLTLIRKNKRFPLSPRFTK